MIPHSLIDGVPTGHIWLTVSDLPDALEKLRRLEESLEADTTHEIPLEPDLI